MAFRACRGALSLSVALTLIAAARADGLVTVRRGEPGGDCISPAERAHISDVIGTYLAAHPERAFGARGVEPPFAIWPMGCNLDSDVVITHFFDHDPTTGFQDYSCRDFTYDGHNGSDAGLRSIGEMELGVPVFAAGDAIVVDRHDGEPDLFPPPDDAYPNYVILDHGGGQFSYYWHLRQNSVLVATEQTVAAGEQIGSVGMSGFGWHPHLHFGAHDAGEFGPDVDPFDGECNERSSLFVEQPELDLTPHLWDFGVWYEDPFATQVPGLPAAFPRSGQIAVSAAGVSFWIIFNNLPADSTWRVQYVRPDGSLAIDTLDVEWGNSTLWRHLWTWWFYDHPDLHTLTGTWHIRFQINGQLMIDAPVEVRAERTPEFNRPPLPVGVRFEPSAPTPDEVLFCRVNAGVLDDFDYDIVRYRYEWRIDGTLLRDVTTAGQGDAIPRGAATAGQHVECRVTPSDGRAAAPPATIAAMVRPACPGDVSGDGRTDLSDLATLLANFGRSGDATLGQGDLDGNRAVDLSDLATLLANFGTTCL